MRSRKLSWLEAALWVLSAICVVCGLSGIVNGAITIDQPPRLDAGEDVDIFIHGLEYTDLPNAEVIYFPREKVRVRPSLSWGLKPFIIFRAQQPGTYLLAVSATVEGEHCYAEAIIQVGEPTPGPTPEPSPIPPGVAAEVVILEETSQRTPSIARIVHSPVLLKFVRSNGLKFRAIDQHLELSDGRPSPIAQHYLKEKGERPLPVLFVATKDRRVLFVDALPSSAEGVVDIVRKFLPKKGR